MMNKKNNVWVTIVVISSTLVMMPTVQAKRLGGGTSFGSKPSYSAPVKRADLPPSNHVSQPSYTAPPVPVHQQPTPSSNQAWKDRALGAAAGLAVGGLVGSMVSGGSEHVNPPVQNYAPPPIAPMAQSNVQSLPSSPSYPPAPVYTDRNGATTSSGGFGLFGWLLLGGLGFLAYRFFFAKKTPANAVSANNYQYSQPASYASAENVSHQNAGFNTDLMFKKTDSSVSSSTINLAKSRNFSMPTGFDHASFIEEVRNCYIELQKAWDHRDFSGIRSLTTDKVFAEIQEQLKASHDINQTDILRIDIDVLDVRELSSTIEAVVLFDALIREDVNAQANQVCEVWHFVKAKSGFHMVWLLDGIQQIED
jgi:predicted lipid-binding transport protein (Tim44 family)